MCLEGTKEEENKTLDFFKTETVIWKQLYTGLFTQLEF